MVNKIPYALIALLSDGKFHSGEAIGEKFGISRSAIWKQLKKLSDLGVNIESIKGKGYRMIDPLVLLSETQIKHSLRKLLPSSRIDVLMTTDSTNEELNRRVFKKEDVVKGDIVISEQQTAGKGRRGKSWQSPFGKNIYLSMVWKFDQGLQKLDGLSLIVGLAVAETLSGLGFKDIGLKWPNDILIENKKVAGILLEVSGDPMAECFVVIGVGINVNMKKGDGNGIDQPWVALNQKGKDDIDRNLLIPKLVESFVDHIHEFEKAGFDQFEDRWNYYDSLHGKEVVITRGEALEFGVAEGVDREGALIVSNGSIERKYTSGEVSIRRHSHN